MQKKTNKVVREWANAKEANKIMWKWENAKEASKVVWNVINKPTKSCGMWQTSQQSRVEGDKQANKVVWGVPRKPTTSCEGGMEMPRKPTTLCGSLEDAKVFLTIMQHDMVEIHTCTTILKRRQKQLHADKTKGNDRSIKNRTHRSEEWLLPNKNNKCYARQTNFMLKQPPWKRIKQTTHPFITSHTNTHEHVKSNKNRHTTSDHATTRNKPKEGRRHTR